MQGRFFAALSLCSSLLIPAGIFVAGIVSNALGADINIILNNMIVILFVILLLRIGKKRGKAD